MSHPLASIDRKTDRFVLRSFRKRDADALLRAIQSSHRELAAFLPWAHPGYSRMDAASFIRDSNRSWREARAYDFAIRRPDDPDRHIGNVSVWFVSRGFRSGEIGYWIRTDETSDGVASEVAREALTIGFTKLKMHRIILRIGVGNRASERVAEKLGFVREGVLREELKVHGKWLDHSVWGMLEHEFHRLHNPEQSRAI
jgi:RimJ/RimL family protein N-acetyltransferase